MGRNRFDVAASHSRGGLGRLSPVELSRQMRGEGIVLQGAVTGRPGPCGWRAGSSSAPGKQNSEVRPRRRSETERYSATDLVKRVTVGVDRMTAPALSMSRCLNSTDVIKGLQQEDLTGVHLEGRQEGENRREVWDAAPSTLKSEEEAVNRGVRPRPAGSWKRRGSGPSPRAAAEPALPALRLQPRGTPCGLLTYTATGQQVRVALSH